MADETPTPTDTPAPVEAPAPPEAPDPRETGIRELLDLLPSLRGLREHVNKVEGDIGQRIANEVAAYREKV